MREEKSYALHMDFKPTGEGYIVKYTSHNDKEQYEKTIFPTLKEAETYIRRMYQYVEKKGEKYFIYDEDTGVAYCTIEKWLQV